MYVPYVCTYVRTPCPEFGHGGQFCFSDVISGHTQAWVTKITDLNTNIQVSFHVQWFHLGPQAKHLLVCTVDSTASFSCA